MEIGLQCISSPMNQYPDGVVHPAPYDWKLFNFKFARVGGMTLANRTTWAAAIAAVPGRVPIIGISTAKPTEIVQGPYDYYEFGNEPNYDKTISPEKYAGLLKAAYTTIKAARPSAQVILGGTDSWQHSGSASKWLSKMMAELERLGHTPATFPFDIIGIHLYPHGPLSEIDRIPEMFGNLESWRWAWRVEKKPIWCTEFGILQDACIFRSMPRVVQTDCITRMMKYARDGGCGLAIWYASDEHEMGLGTSQTIVDAQGVSELNNSVAMWNSLSLA